MAKISELADGGNLLNDDELIVLRAGGNVRATVANLPEVDASGNQSFADGEKAIFGTGNDLQIYHTGSHSFVQDTGSGDLYLATNGDKIILRNTTLGESFFEGTSNGDSKIFYNGLEKLATTTTGIDVTGSITSSGNLTVNGADVTITANIIHSGDGDTFFGFNANDSYRVVTGGTQRLLVNSSGIDVTGTVTADGLTVQGASDSTVLVEATGGNDASLFLTEAGTGNVGAQFVYDGGVNEFFLKVGNNTDTTRLSVSRDTGDISFYEDTGTTAKFQWSASNERLTIDSSASDVTSLATAVSESVLELNANSSFGTDAIYFGAFSSSGRQYIQAANGAGTGSYDIALNPYGGNVGIGTDSPSRQLTVQSSGAQISLLSDTTGSSVLNMGDTADDNIGRIQYDNANDKMLFRVNGSDAVTIDSSGVVQISNATPTLKFTDTDNNYDTTIQGLSGSLVLKADSGAEFGTESIQFRTGGNEAMRISSAGLVEIGTQATGSASSKQLLSLVNPLGNIGAGARLWLSGTNATTRGTYIEAEVQSSGNDHDLIFATSASASTPSEAMRIDSSGNLLVGKNGTNIGAVGVEAKADGQLWATRDGNPVLSLNRETSDGSIAVFYKDATAVVGSIGSNPSSYLYIGNGDTTLSFSPASDLIYPTGTAGAQRDGAVSLGNGANRFSDLYLSGRAYINGGIKLDSGDGIYFGQDGTSANKLDDYEEGAWTPEYEAASLFTSITYDASTYGEYTKVGNLVHIQGVLRTDSISGGSGAVTLAGLPFTVASSKLSSLSISYSAAFAGDFPASINIAGGGTTANFRYRTTANGALSGNLDVSDLGTGANANYIVFSGTYVTTA